jgi:hypothetical protein
MGAAALLPPTPGGGGEALDLVTSSLDVVALALVAAERIVANQRTRFLR